MRATKRHWLWALASTLVCTVLLLAWVTQPPEKDLLAQATEIAGVKANQDIHPYGWISDRELLLFHFQPDSSWSLGRYDLAARRETPLPALSLLYRQSGGEENGFPPRISPDGKHFLWINRKNQQFCSGLDGVALSHQMQHGSLLCWVDNTHWALLKEDKNATHLLALEAHGLRPPFAAQRLLFAPPIMLRRSQSYEIPDLTFTTDHRLLELLSTFGQSTPICVNEFSVTSRHAVERTHFLPLPQNPCRPFLIGSAQSPINGRVALVLLFQPEPPFWQPLLHLLKMKDKPDAIGCLCVGDPETGQVHEVGRITVEADKAGYGPIGDVRWLPSGKRLSFKHQGVLYTVAAD